MSHTLHPEIKFSNPGIYHIQVLGNIRQELWDYFEGEIELVSGEKNEQVTTSFKIHVRDQAELTGLLNMLYEWRYVLLAVKIEGHIEDTAPK